MSQVTAKPSQYKRSNKVCLVGFCQGSRDLAPYDDPSWEIWGLNKGYIFMPQRYDRWFETHDKKIYEWEIRRPNGHKDWLKAFHGPIYMHVADSDYPNSIALPLVEMAEAVGVNQWFFKNWTDPMEPVSKAPYLTSTIAYQIALAIMEGYEEIALVGIDLNTHGEYAWQKAGVEYLLGVAAGLGIKVYIPEKCALLHGELYGRGFLKPEGEKITVSQLEMRLKGLQEEASKLGIQYHELTGMERECRWVLDQMVPGVNHEKLDERCRQIQKARMECEARLQQNQGSQKEVMQMISTTPEGQPGRQAIEQLAAQVDAGGERMTEQQEEAVRELAGAAA